MPRMAPKTEFSIVQRTASFAGWSGVAVLMGVLLYWLYLNGISENRNWIVNIGLGLGGGLITYFVYGMGAVILAGLRSPEGKKSIRSAVLIFAILAILSIANVLAYRRHYQWDLTGNRRLTLAPMTKRLLKDLKKPIIVTAFYTSSPQRRFEAQQAQQVRDLLDQYADKSPNFKYQMVDYVRENAKWSDARMTSAPPVVLFTNVSGGREEIKGTTEKDFTGALLKLTRSQKKKIYFTIGHRELNPDSFDRQGAAVVKQVLVDEQHEVATIDLMGKERKVPADCSVLVIAGPDVELKDEEVKAVKEYLDGGGHALILLRTGGPNLAALLKDWGVKPGYNVVEQLVDLGGLTAISRQVRITKFETHDINRSLGAVSFPLARTIENITPAPIGVNVTPIIRSSADTISKALAKGQNKINPRPEPTDPKGPFTLAAACEKAGGDKKKARVVVVGATEWAMDLLAEDPTTSNRYLFTNAVNWLAEEDALVDIPPKDEPVDQVTLTPEQRIRSFYMNMLLFPVACLFMAVFVWWKRR